MVRLVEDKLLNDQRTEKQGFSLQINLSTQFGLDTEYRRAKVEGRELS